MKPLSIAQLLLSISVMALALTQITGLWTNAVYLYEPLLVAVLLIQGAQYWNKSRPIACVSLLAAIFLFGTAAYIFLC